MPGPPSQFARRTVDLLTNPSFPVGIARNPAGGQLLQLDEIGKIIQSASAANVPWFNAKDFGAAGDGVNDDTQAILNALNEAKQQGAAGTGAGGAAIVFFPRGTYLVSGVGAAAVFDLTGGVGVANKLQIVGEGVETTVIKRGTGTGPVFYGLGTSASPKGYVRVADLTINGNSTGGNGIDLTYFNGFLFLDNVEAINCTDGFKLSNCFAGHLHRCIARLNSGYGFNLNRENDETALVGCYASDNTTAGYRFADGWSGPWVGCAAVDNPVGVLLENTADAGVTAGHALTRGSQFVGGWIEGNVSQTEGFKTNSAVATKIRGIVFSGLLCRSGDGNLISLDDVEGAVGTIQTVGSADVGGTNNHLVLSSTVEDCQLIHWYEQAAAETIYTDSGTNNVRWSQLGFSKLTSTGALTVTGNTAVTGNLSATGTSTLDGQIATAANLQVKLAAGDTQPQAGLNRNGSTGGKISLGIGGSTSTDCTIRRRAAGEFEVETGAWDCKNGLQVGTGTLMTKFLSATKTWDPGSIADGAQTNTTVTVTGALAGDMAVVSFTVAVTAGAFMVAHVTAADTVTVTLFNKTGGALDLASGTLRVAIFRAA